MSSEEPITVADPPVQEIKHEDPVMRIELSGAGVNIYCPLLVEFAAATLELLMVIRGEIAKVK